MKLEDFRFIKPGEVRVRIAPSPTGFLHIGTARTALFNYLFAKKHQGIFIVRLEDTDTERSKPECERDILDHLRWLGIEWDEGPASIFQGEIEETPNSPEGKPPASYGAGKFQIPNYRKNYIGEYGPYKQSERLNVYKKYSEKLLDEDKAYFCFCSEEELDAQRQYQMSIGEAPRYSGKCSHLSKEEVKKYLAEDKPSIIRFRVSGKKVEFEDLIRGHLEFDASLIGDIVVAKNLATPLYNFAVVIDDFEMKINHVIRGEDHISNTPKQILLQEALGFPRPKYAHLPLILGSDRAKLSKRHGAVAIADYKKAGYLPEALINFMVFLGWNPGGEREIYSLSSLIKEFSLEGVQKGGAVFNIKRLDFLNGFYIRQKSVEKLTELCLPYLIEANLIELISGDKEKMPSLSLTGYFGREIVQEFFIPETKEKISFDYLQRIVSIHQGRLKKLSEIVELADFFFKDRLEYDKDLLKWRKMTDKEIVQSLDKLEKILSKIKTENWNKENLEKVLMPEAEKMGLEAQQAGYGVKDRGYLLWPFRVALTGKKASAGPFEISEILGKEKTIKRIKEARRIIK